MAPFHFPMPLSRPIGSMRITPGTTFPGTKSGAEHYISLTCILRSIIIITNLKRIKKGKYKLRLRLEWFITIFQEIRSSGWEAIKWLPALFMFKKMKN